MTFIKPSLLLVVALVAMSGLTGSLLAEGQSNLATEPYHLDTGLQSRSISFENPTGEPGKGGQAESPLGVGRKGAPAIIFQSGEHIELANIKGPGTIRHIWMTLNSEPRLLRGLVIRAYWDGQKHPSIESPLGDFFGFAHGKTGEFQTAVHSVGENHALNIWLPMPFVENARITLSNESDQSTSIYYQIDYTIGDQHTPAVGRLHTLFKRENPTQSGIDFELLPERRGKGRFLGAVMGVRTLQGDWWGEGEVKMYIDGDKTFPTIVGTGAEDYVGLSFGLQQTPFLYHGANRVTPKDGVAEYGGEGEVSMYRWHLLDPIYWQENIRVTIQQIGFSRAQYYAKPGATRNPQDFKEITRGYKERADDRSTATFWYEPVPSDPLPEMPGAKERMADLAGATMPD
jgi:hypothetical protein